VLRLRPLTCCGNASGTSTSDEGSRASSVSVLAMLGAGDRLPGWLRLRQRRILPASERDLAGGPAGVEPELPVGGMPSPGASEGASDDSVAMESNLGALRREVTTAADVRLSALPWPGGYAERTAAGTSQSDTGGSSGGGSGEYAGGGLWRASSLDGSESRGASACTPWDAMLPAAMTRVGRD